MSKVKVSIIIPVYNVESYIAKCLDSLVNQTLKDIEIIIVNDGSPDNSQKIIEKYVKKYPNIIKSFITKNGGQGSARNYGLTKATGKYIGYVDSDDFVSTDMYEKMYNLAEENNYDIVITDYIDYYEKDGKEKREYSLKEEPLFNSPCVWNKIYKKELLEDIEFKSKVWYEDLPFTLKVLSKTNNIGYLNEPLYYYLIRSNSTMNNNNIKRNLEILDAFDDTIMYFKKHNIYEENYSKIEYLAIYHIYTSTIVRIITSEGVSSKDKKEIINKLREYMYTNFPTFKKNEYIHLLQRNRKIIYTLINLEFYNTIKLIFKIK